MIYLASPYSDPSPAVREHRYQAAVEKVAWAIKHGYPVFSPIIYTHYWYAKTGLNFDAENWWEFNLSFMSRSNSAWVLMLSGWKESIGVSKEISYFHEHGIKISYLIP